MRCCIVLEESGPSSPIVLAQVRLINRRRVRHVEAGKEMVCKRPKADVTAIGFLGTIAVCCFMLCCSVVEKLGVRKDKGRGRGLR